MRIDYYIVTTNRILGWVFLLVLWDTLTSTTYYPLMVCSFLCSTQVFYQPHAAPSKSCQRCCKLSFTIIPAYWLVTAYVFKQVVLGHLAVFGVFLVVFECQIILFFLLFNYFAYK